MKNNEKAIKALNENNQKAIEASVNNQKAIEAGMNKEEGLETDVNKEEGIEAGKQSYESGKDNGSGKGEIDLDVIDRMFSAVLTANESEERIKNLRPHAEAAVKELLRQLGKPPRFTGTIEYHGFKIRIQRPKSFTWELNTQIDDPQIAYYKAMSRQYDELNMQIKAKRREMKGIAETLALKYPNSESIKSGFSIALMQ